ncbi:MAG TPA: SDR family oxidoreductase [Gemmatimonadaceae bacterium]
MSDRAAGRVALVTGAGQRVGQAIALALGAEGFRVAVHYHASADGARRTTAALRELGAESAAFAADLAQPDVPDALVALVTTHFGKLDLLVNSAAIMRRLSLDTVTPAEWDAIFAVNLRAPFFLSLAAARAMGAAGGAIVNIADHLAHESWPMLVPHGISKGAVESMTRQLAARLAPLVRVNAVVPGAVLAPEGWSSAAQQQFIDATPLRRLGTPDDVAQAVIYLASAPYVTGEVLFVDGGRHLG